MVNHLLPVVVKIPPPRVVNSPLEDRSHPMMVNYLLSVVVNIPPPTVVSTPLEDQNQMSYDLKKNLISVSTIDSQGYKYSFEYGVLIVSNGALVVIKGKFSNGLYVLQGSTVIGAAFVSSSSDPYLDTTHLWHMRLGYMSEDGITILSKRGLLDGQKTDRLDFCENSVYGKQCRVKFTTATHRTKSILDYIHSNL
ncbi:hypothetical protein EZV62_004828 [Acer yangbiense]|uniref:GAG-pre-integrase domain-containing protein n=1 Tax=Acer yangbiense TaxID=1000413 RepID=A0A5C7IKU3_9ROSI|nr:hypothetical protein EZV62_004828 [Acer yangbiense]